VQWFRVGGVVPRRSEVVHYSHCLHIVAPVVAPAVVLSLTLQADSFQEFSNIPMTAYNLPHDRASAVVQGTIGPMLGEIQDFHLRNRIPTMESLLQLPSREYVEDLELIARRPENDSDSRR